MSRLRTVLGDLPAESIDRVLPHEHIFCDFSRVTNDRNHILNDPHVARLELAAFRAAVPPAPGKQHAIVDVTLPDFGRNPEELVRIARASEMAIVMGTGWYRSPYYPQSIARTSTQELAEAMVEEITDGVQLRDGTRVRAGVIGEIGADRDVVDPAEERVLRAAGRASIQTGAAVTTHAFLYPVGKHQLDILEEEGVDPGLVAIGHADSYLDIRYHRELLTRGAWLQFDTCGRTHILSDELRAESLVRLLDEGWGSRLLISSDRCHRSDMLQYGGAGYAWTWTGFALLLKSLGVDDTTLAQLTSANPMALLGNIRDRGDEAA